MRAKFINEKNIKPVTTTVDELFTWYMGSSDWGDNSDITNLMSIDGKHAQDDVEDEMIIVRWLELRGNRKIKVYSTLYQYDHSYELEFELEGKNFSIQSMNPALVTDDEDDRYNL